MRILKPKNLEYIQNIVRNEHFELSKQEKTNLSFYKPSTNGTFPFKFSISLVFTLENKIQISEIL